MVMPWPFPDHQPWDAQPQPSAPVDADGRLAVLVAQRLAGDWSTRRRRIVVTVQNGVVILTGVVTDPQTRRAAAELAWDTHGVVDVCNALRLAGSRRHR
ncbi:BON domain-containing protein [Micromonospora echinofusca]|uniref:BON domain-containing protein n=1 Tax=Micromonospora echinofusca TaxID=47858 RepID=A0ABS3VR47_MICEH|nr:BON domain-containing protein [Micromonospora echinofusca]MBO4207014.1 BON domain-containing protein [Micromonospora echinofusca]